MSNRRIAILLAVSAMSTASVRAQEPASALPERLTLPILLRLVAERSPRLAVEQTAIDTAEAERITAGALPNPSVSYGRFTPSGGARTMFEGSQQQQATVDFPLLIGGQRGARIEAAEQGLLAARARIGLAGNDLALRAADLFVGLQAAQEKASMLDESVAEIERVATIVSGRLKSGAASRYELTRVEVELAGMNARRGLMAKAAADLRAAQRRREAIESEADVELRRLVDALAQRRTVLERFRLNVGERIPALKQMAEDAYRLGRGSLLELIDAARSRLDARLTEVDLRAATAGQEPRILGLTGKLGGLLRPRPKNDLKSPPC